MALLQSFDPPAYMNDFDGTPGMRLAWSDFVSGAFDAAIQSELKNVTSNRGRSVATVQFFNATKFDPGGALVEQAITWNAFPKELLVQLGRSRALVEADGLCPLSAYGGRLFQYDPDRRTVTSRALGVPDDVFYRPQIEYCEWHVKRNPLTGEILTLTFTSESSEYWAAMFGQSMSAGGTFRRRLQAFGQWMELLSCPTHMLSLLEVADRCISAHDVFATWTLTLISRSRSLSKGRICPKPATSKARR